MFAFARSLSRFAIFHFLKFTFFQLFQGDFRERTLFGFLKLLQTLMFKRTAWKFKV